MQDPTATTSRTAAPGNSTSRGLRPPARRGSSLLLAAGAAAAALSLGVLAMGRFVGALLEERAVRDLEEVAFDAADKIDRNLFERCGDAVDFGVMYVARHWDEAPPAGPERLETRFDDLMRVYAPNYLLLLMADAEGRIIAVNRVGPEGRPIDTRPLLGRDASAEPWFREGARLDPRSGRPHIEDLHEDPLLAEVYGDRGLALSFSRPVVRDGRLAGVLSTRFDWAVAEEIFSGAVDRVRRGGAHSLNLTVRRRDGLTLYSGIREEVLRPSGASLPGPLLSASVRSRGHAGYTPSLGWTFLATRERSDALREVAALQARSLGYAASALVVLLACVLLAAAALGPRRASRRRLVPSPTIAVTLAALGFLLLGAFGVHVIVEQDALAREGEKASRVLEAATHLNGALAALDAPADDVFLEWDVPGQRALLARKEAAVAEASEALEALLGTGVIREGLAPVRAKAEAARGFVARTLDLAAGRERLRLAGASDRELRAAEDAVAKAMLRANASVVEAQKELKRILAAARAAMDRAQDRAHANVERLFLLGSLAALSAFAAVFLGWRAARARREADEASGWLRSLAAVEPGPEPGQVFGRLAEALARALGSRWAIVGRITGDGSAVETLGFWDSGRLAPGFRYPLAGTPCAEVVEKGLCHHEHGVADLFPEDAMLREIGAQGYIGRLLRNVSGRTIGILNAFHDGPLPVTPSQTALFGVYVRRAEVELGRLLAAEGLAASEVMHRTIMRGLADAVITIDREGTIRAMNPAAERIFGYGPGEATGRNVTLLMPEGYHAAHRASLARHLETGEARVVEKGTLEVEGLRRDGAIFPLDISVTTFTVNGEPHFTGVLRDITERRRMEAEVRRLARAAEAAGDAILMTDTGGDILWVNPAFTTITGYAQEEVIGRNPRFLKSGLHPPEFFASLWATISAGQVWTGQVVNRRKDGTLCHAAMTIAPFFAAKGGTEGYVGVQRDVSAEVERERDLAAAKEAALDASRAKSEFLANMSHEIRTPLNGILGFLGLLRETELTAEQHEYVDIVHSSGEALLTVINDILDFSKVEAGRIDLEEIAFDLREVIEGVGGILAPAAQEKGIELLCTGSWAGPLWVRGDPTRLRQVLLNLAGNAVKFTERGEVSLVAEVEVGGDGPVRVRIQVRDTGIGIPSDRRERLFQAFSQVDGSTTRRFGGTGLGLAISQRLVELMGGTIEVESEPGRGSTFTVRLALPRGEETPATPPAAGGLAGARVLVVDDNAANRRLLVEELGRAGCETRTASGGEEALGALRAAREAGQDFHVALLDMQMPGMDGLALARAIRSDPANARMLLVLVTSMHSGRGDIPEESGFAAVLLKPVRQGVLLGTIADLLRVGPPGGEGGRGGPRARNLRVLVVEDHPVNQKLMRVLLGRAGVPADVAANGREAVEATARRDYDLVLMDVQMPVMDGYEATAAIRAREAGGRRTPIIALTARATREDVQRCLAAGMDDHLSKPVQLPDLWRVLDRWGPRDDPGDARRAPARPAAPAARR